MMSIRLAASTISGILRLPLMLALVLTTAGALRAEGLIGIRIAPDAEADYDRARDYGSGWRQDDEDCQDVRQEVLIDESLVPVTLSDDDCRVLEGLWFDPYTEKWFTRPTEGHTVFIDIDHLVPLKEAHDSGGHAWERAKRIAYANDLTNPGHLIAVDASANRSKRDRDPAEWMPPNEDFHCAYALAWVAVKRAWQLTVDQAEADAIGLVLARC